MIQDIAQFDAPGREQNLLHCPTDSEGPALRFAPLLLMLYFFPSVTALVATWPWARIAADLDN